MDGGEEAKGVGEARKEGGVEGMGDKVPRGLDFSCACAISSAN